MPTTDYSTIQNPLMTNGQTYRPSISGFNQNQAQQNAGNSNNYSMVPQGALSYLQPRINQFASTGQVPSVPSIPTAGSGSAPRAIPSLASGVLNGTNSMADVIQAADNKIIRNVDQFNPTSQSQLIDRYNFVGGLIQNNSPLLQYLNSDLLGRLLPGMQIDDLINQLNSATGASNSLIGGATPTFQNNPLNSDLINMATGRGYGALTQAPETAYAPIYDPNTGRAISIASGSNNPISTNLSGSALQQLRDMLRQNESAQQNLPYNDASNPFSGFVRG